MSVKLAEMQADRRPVSRQAALAPGESIESFIAREQLFAIDAQGVARLPAVIGGALLVPELPSPDAVEAAIASGRRSVDIGETHLLLVEADVGGSALRGLAFPRVTDPAKLVPGDIDDQIRSLHPLKFDAIA